MKEKKNCSFPSSKMQTCWTLNKKATNSACNLSWKMLSIKTNAVLGKDKLQSNQGQVDPIKYKLRISSKKEQEIHITFLILSAFKVKLNTFSKKINKYRQANYFWLHKQRSVIWIIQKTQILRRFTAEWPKQKSYFYTGYSSVTINYLKVGSWFIWRLTVKININLEIFPNSMVKSF